MGKSSRNDAVFRRRCLKWLRLRLPLAWVLNQALLGRVSGCGGGDDDAGVSAGSAAAGTAAAGGGDGDCTPEATAAAAAAVAAKEEEEEEENRCLGRGLTISTVSGLPLQELASRYATQQEKLSSLVYDT